MSPSTVPLCQCKSQSRCEHPDRIGEGWLPASPDYFYWNSGRKSLQKTCKHCCCRLSREYNASNRDRIKTRNAKKYAADPDKFKERIKEYKRRNPDKEKELQKKSYLRNPQRFKEKKRRWESSHPEAVKQGNRVKNERRRSRKKSLPNTLTTAEWEYALSYFSNCCAVCGIPFDSLLVSRAVSSDHWIPITYQGDDNPGTVAENIVPLCRGQGGCNELKADRNAHEWLIERYGVTRTGWIEARIQAYFEHVLERRLNN